MSTPASSSSIAKLFSAFFTNNSPFASFINGELRPGTGETIRLTNAYTGEQHFHYADCGPEHAVEAVAAAKQAQIKWAALSHAERGRRMYAAGQLIRQHSEALAQLESASSAKPIRDCRGESLRVAEMFEYYAGWADKLYGEVIPVPSGHLNFTQRRPVGVVVQITPWNAPIFTAGWQIAPAIACGNAVVLKPSELTPFSSVVLAHLLHQAGLPKGLVNVLAGTGTAVLKPALETHDIAKVVFVGSVNTGKIVAQTAASYLVPCVLELGGKSANIVFDDANLDRAVIGAQAAIFSGAGQSCVAGSRLLVQRSVYDKFLNKLVTGASKLAVGDPASETTEIGPVCNERQYQHVRTSIEQAIANGATLALGDTGPDRPGFRVSPTILSNVSNDMAVAQEEIFGPVVVVIPFEDEHDAIKLANQSRFGLAGAVWSENGARGHRVAEALNAGTVWINGYKTINVASPFGGIKESGYGRSSGIDALQEYTTVKSVWVETAANPAATFGYL